MELKRLSKFATLSNIFIIVLIILFIVYLYCRKSDILIIGLVLLTAWYAYSAEKTWKEMKKDRKITLYERIFQYFYIPLFYHIGELKYSNPFMIGIFDPAKGEQQYIKHVTTLKEICRYGYYADHDLSRDLNLLLETENRIINGEGEELLKYLDEFPDIIEKVETSLTAEMKNAYLAFKKIIKKVEDD